MSTLIAELSASTFVAEHASAAAKALAFPAVVVRVFQEALAAEFGARRCGLSATARGARHVAASVVALDVAASVVALEAVPVAQAVALEVVGAGALEETFAAELGARGCGLSAAA